MARRKPPKMLEAEQRFGRDITEIIVENIAEHGQAETARMLGISRSNLGYWLLRLDVQVKKIVVAPGDTITVERARDKKRREQEQSQVTRLNEYTQRKVG